jgi:FtsH-binding integral membrane protein
MRYQFTLSGLLLTLFFGAGLSAVTVRFAGVYWETHQKLIAYGVCMGLPLLVFFWLRGRLRAVAFLLLAPLFFVCAVIAASLFSRTDEQGWPVTSAPQPTVGTGRNPPAPPPPVLQTPIVGGTR